MIKMSEMGFCPENSAHDNYIALQNAVNCGGDIYIDVPGVYKLNDTVTIGDNTSVYFCNGAYIKREKNPAETGPVFINKGAYQKIFNHNIKICGLKLICDGVVSDEVNINSKKGIMGISAHIVFYYIKNLEIYDFQCLDLPAKDFCIQICTFENVVVRNVHIEGLKDGIHFGKGSGFHIHHGIFKTFDDPIALNSYDYSISNPEVGWIENGVIEDCRDLNDTQTVGYFCRISAGGWVDWFEGMEVQWSDTVCHNGRLYRVVFGKPDGKVYKSYTPPVHESGYGEYDGIWWYMMQDGNKGGCACRNIFFRDIFLQKKRDYALSMSSSKNEWCRNYYPNAPVAVHDNISFENVVCADEVKTLIYSASPFYNVRFSGCAFNGCNIILDNINTPGMEYTKANIFISDSVIMGKKDDFIKKADGRDINVKMQNCIEQL